MINIGDIAIIESVDEQGTTWGVSFAGSNPEPEMFVGCASKEDAGRLTELLLSVESSGWYGNPDKTPDK